MEWNNGMEWWNSGMTTPTDRVLSRPGAHNEERKGRGEGARSTHAFN